MAPSHAAVLPRPMPRAAAPRGAWSAQLLGDVVREAAIGLSRNRLRAGLSMLGISWGIVSVVMLLAYGNGFQAALERGFKGAFGDGVVIVWPGQTSKQAGGERAGKRVRLKEEDVLAVAAAPFVKFVSPEFTREFPVTWGTKQCLRVCDPGNPASCGREGWDTGHSELEAPGPVMKFRKR